jgi:hypothetical protein
VTALAGAAGQKSSAGGVLKHLADTLVGLGRALKVLVGTNLLANFLTLLSNQTVSLSMTSSARSGCVPTKSDS